MSDSSLPTWFLSSSQRGNRDTEIDRHHPDDVAWSHGNRVTLLVHGARYFDRLCDVVSATESGDEVYFTDWRGDADELLRPDGPTVAELFTSAVSRGVTVRGLLWRSHSDHLSFSGKENERMGRALNEAGAILLLDQRVRHFGSHHQKLVIVRHPDDPGQNVAFVGGIDLSHGRRDSPDHTGDPQPPPMDPRYGPHSPWHDASLEIQGPAIDDLLFTFTERWNDPAPVDRRTPYRMFVQRLARMPRHAEPIPDLALETPSAGKCAVQVLRTYGHKHPGYPFAHHGERSVGRALTKAFSRARSYIYMEDQYLWSRVVAERCAAALRAHPKVQFIAVVPRYPDADGRLDGPPNRIGQIEALSILRRAAPGRVSIFDLENAAGTPIYVHAKICIIDDVWLSCGSANANRRSWTADSELTCGIIDEERDTREPLAPEGGGDTARQFARNARLELWSEHLGLDRDDVLLADPAGATELWMAIAQTLDAWHASGRRGPRPRGQVRQHDPRPVSRSDRWWTRHAYSILFDPDGRTRKRVKGDSL